MIIHYTEEEEKRLLDLLDHYDSRLKELSAKLTSIRDPEELDLLAKQSDDREAVYHEWVALGSPEWKQTRDEYLSLLEEYTKKRTALYEEIEKEHFAQFEGDPERILEDARHQAEELIENRYSFYEDLVRNKMTKDGDLISGFSGHDLRVDGVKFWLDSKEVVKDIKRSIKLHYDALKDDPDLLNRLNDAIIEVVSASPYISDKEGKLGKQYLFKKASHTKKSLPVYDASAEQGFILFPTTEMNNVLYTLLSENGDYKDAALAINKVAKRTVANSAVVKETGRRYFEVKTPKTTTRIELLKRPKREQGETAKKVLIFIENELYRHSYYKGRLVNDLLSFPLQEMAEKMKYSSEKNARRAFNDAADILTAFRATGHVMSGKKDLKTADILSTFFPTMRVVNGQCYVRLNKDLNWQPLLNSYSEMPDSWFSLPGNARDLEYWMFQNARVNKNRVDSESNTIELKISLRSVAARLSLPVGKTKNPTRDVKTPIETAIKQINDSLDPQDFHAEIKTDLGAGIAEYLTGYILVVFKGKYAEKLSSIKQIQDAVIEKNLLEKKERDLLLEMQIRNSLEDEESDDD